MSTFKERFLDYNFDEILISSNNPLINSVEHYIKFKQSYFAETQVNYKTYIAIDSQIKQLNPVSEYRDTENHVHYTYIDESLMSELNQKLKNIEIQQGKLFDNFVHYIGFLNANQSKLVSTSKERAQSSIVLPRMKKLLRIKSYN